jgi:predicted DNA-binding transcriptional regulator AlpA
LTKGNDMPLAVIKRKEFRRRMGGISRATEFRGRRDDPEWPEVVELTSHLTGYIESEADAFIAKRAERRLSVTGAVPRAAATETLASSDAAEPRRRKRTMLEGGGPP